MNSSLSCCLLTTAPFPPTKKETLQHTANRFSDAAKNFGLSISLKKTDVLYQLPPREAHCPPHNNIDGTNLNAVEHITYLGSVISNDAIVSKDIDNRLTKVSSSFGRLSKRVRQSLPICNSDRLKSRRLLIQDNMFATVLNVYSTTLQTETGIKKAFYRDLPSLLEQADSTSPNIIPSSCQGSKHQNTPKTNSTS